MDKLVFLFIFFIFTESWACSALGVYIINLISSLFLLFTFSFSSIQKWEHSPIHFYYRNLKPTTWTMQVVIAVSVVYESQLRSAFENPFLANS